MLSDGFIMFGCGIPFLADVELRAIFKDVFKPFVVADNPSASAPITNLRLIWLLSNWSAEEGVDETLATAFIAGTERVTVETFAGRLATLRLLTDVAIVVVMILDVNGTKYYVFI
jgi:hypothetical protein